MIPSREEDRNALIALLRYFLKGRTMKDVPDDVIVEGVSPDEMREKAQSLLKLSYIARVRGKTSGTVYLITEMGRDVLRELES